MTDDVARKFDDAYRATKGKVAELANKVDDALAPGMVTTEGIIIKPPQIKDSNVLEMRGRGGYETNQVTDKLGTKIPKVTQPEQVAPSMKPNRLNKPLGEAEKIPVKADGELVRGLTKQNEAAKVLAKNGYRVEQKPRLTNVDRMSNPWLKADKKPDFKVEDKIFDVFSPSKGKSADNIRGEIKGKIEAGQTRRIVLNMDDSSVNLNQLKKVIWEKPIVELEQILIIKDGRVTKFFPFNQ